MARTKQVRPEVTPLWLDADVAALVGWGPQTIAQKVSRNGWPDGPERIVLNGRRRYKPEAVYAWLESRTVRPEAGPLRGRTALTGARPLLARDGA